MNDKTYPPYKFRKKPVVIEAWRIVPNSPQPSWVREALAKSEGVTGAIDWDAAGEGMWINTLEGCMTANEGDWLIKGIKGELYACKPDIFEATYEAVDVDADREARGVPQGWKLIKDSTHAERSWPDDVTSGQSLYSCCCAECGRNFNGHKWRACCRVCAEAPPAPAAQVGKAGWLPIKTSPKDGSKFLAMTAHGHVRLVHWADPRADKYPIEPEPNREMWPTAPIYWRSLKSLVSPAPAAQAEQHRPDVLERLTYHALERDDLTLEECLSFLADGWRKVHGRTERQMVMQILALLAGAPAQPAEVKAERVPADVVEAAQRIQANGYRAPLAWARKVFDWVASQEPTQPTEARAERAAALETNCAANAMLRTVNRMVEASSVGDDALVAMAEQIRAEAERMSREATGVLIRSKTKDATQSTSTTGGA